jgi:hypothetical protein
MPNVNISDARGRDAVVKGESTRSFRPVRYVGPNGGPAYTRRLLNSTVNHDYDTLLEKFKTPEAIAEALVSGDPEVDLEHEGMVLWDMQRVYINPDEELVFHIKQEEVVRTPEGEVRERRPKRELEANVDGEIPLTWTGKTIPKVEAIRKYVFRAKLQIVHINGLTYDFLYEMAKELHTQKALMIVGAGPKGKQPLIFRRRSVPYRAFLEGRIDGESYILLMHLSNMEMMKPKDMASDAVSEGSAAGEQA